MFRQEHEELMVASIGHFDRSFGDYYSEAPKQLLDRVLKSGITDQRFFRNCAKEWGFLEGGDIARFVVLRAFPIGIEP